MCCFFKVVEVKSLREILESLAGGKPGNYRFLFCRFSLILDCACDWEAKSFKMLTQLTVNTSSNVGFLHKCLKKKAMVVPYSQVPSCRGGEGRKQ